MKPGECDPPSPYLHYSPNSSLIEVTCVYNSSYPQSGLIAAQHFLQQCGLRNDILYSLPATKASPLPTDGPRALSSLTLHWQQRGGHYCRYTYLA